MKMPTIACSLSVQTSTHHSALTSSDSSEMSNNGIPSTALLLLLLSLGISTTTALPFGLLFSNPSRPGNVFPYGKNVEDISPLLAKIPVPKQALLIAAAPTKMLTCIVLVRPGLYERHEATEAEGPDFCTRLCARRPECFFTSLPCHCPCGCQATVNEQ